MSLIPLHPRVSAGSFSDDGGAAMMAAFAGGALGAAFSPFKMLNNLRQNRQGKKAQQKQNQQLSQSISQGLKKGEQMRSLFRKKVTTDKAAHSITLVKPKAGPMIILV